MTGAQLSSYSQKIKVLVDNSGKSLRKISLEIQKDIDPTFSVKRLQKILTRSGVEPRLGTLAILAEYFHVSIDYFIHGALPNDYNSHYNAMKDNENGILPKNHVIQHPVNDNALHKATEIVNEEEKKVNHEIRLQNLKEQLGFEFN